MDYNLQNHRQIRACLWLLEINSWLLPWLAIQVLEWKSLLTLLHAIYEIKWTDELGTWKDYTGYLGKTQELNYENGGIKEWGEEEVPSAGYNGTTKA